MQRRQRTGRPVPNAPVAEQPVIARTAVQHVAAAAAGDHVIGHIAGESIVAVVVDFHGSAGEPHRCQNTRKCCRLCCRQFGLAKRGRCEQGHRIDKRLHVARGETQAVAGLDIEPVIGPGIPVPHRYRIRRTDDRYDKIVAGAGKPELVAVDRIEENQHVARRGFAGIVDDIRAVATQEFVAVIAGAAGQHVVSPAAGQNVGAVPAIQRVVPGKSQQDVVTGKAVHRLAIGRREHDVVTGGSEQARRHIEGCWRRRVSAG